MNGRTARMSSKNSNNNAFLFKQKSSDPEFTNKIFVDNDMTTIV